MMMMKNPSTLTALPIGRASTSELEAEPDPRKAFSPLFVILVWTVRLYFLWFHLSSLQFLTDINSFVKRKHWDRTARLASSSEECGACGREQQINLSFYLCFVSCMCSLINSVNFLSTILNKNPGFIGNDSTDLF